jgi:hypothetical protein
MDQPTTPGQDPQVPTEPQEQPHQAVPTTPETEAAPGTVLPSEAETQQEDRAQPEGDGGEGEKYDGGEIPQVEVDQSSERQYEDLTEDQV